MNKLMIKHNDHGVEGTDIFVELCAMPDKIPFMRSSDSARMKHSG